ncbi:hypothetical protein M431DRAFT_533759 [Trichoderma harzianum CBS 226.95]|uniref:Uncharacterized protein n=1 Tax=Trichoderma harzianum CBS 226.95 TaxID=983964 RepID=A0A2T4A0Y4_TRIHA|nr:hypothetical protein M431DRAFT_533759 [Trichoderma harzianum CBS 226.95]PTB50720.1 hypothetical protein M431DRAFT_533759 [Trichoderma harzianum CBS 226.95]
MIYYLPPSSSGFRLSSIVNFFIVPATGLLKAFAYFRYLGSGTYMPSLMTSPEVLLLLCSCQLLKPVPLGSHRLSAWIHFIFPPTRAGNTQSLWFQVSFGVPLSVENMKMRVEIGTNMPYEKSVNWFLARDDNTATLKTIPILRVGHSKRNASREGNLSVGSSQNGSAYEKLARMDEGLRVEADSLDDDGDGMDSDESRSLPPSEVPSCICVKNTKNDLVEKRRS